MFPGLPSSPNVKLHEDIRLNVIRLLKAGDDENVVIERRKQILVIHKKTNTV